MEGYEALISAALVLVLVFSFFFRIIQVDGESMAEEEMYSVENLMPACRQCNFYKSTLPLEVFRDRIRSVLWANLKKEFNYRLALKYGLIEEHDVPITFFFENF